MSGASEFTSRNDGVRKSHFMIPLQQRPMDGRFWTLVILLIDNIVHYFYLGPNSFAGVWSSNGLVYRFLLTIA